MIKKYKKFINHFYLITMLSLNLQVWLINVLIWVLIDHHNIW